MASQADVDGGFVLIYRRLLDHTAFRNQGEAMAFAWLVMRAAWRPATVRYKDRQIRLKRGQLAISVRDMATHLDRPKGWVERFLQRVTRDQMIRTHAETGVNVITICNYDLYQPSKVGGGTANGTQTGQDRDRTGTQNNELNEGKKGEWDSNSGESREDTPFNPPQPEWSAWIEMRRKLGKAPTEHAVKLALAKLERLQTEGHDPRDVLNQSTLNSYTGLFPIKEVRQHAFADGKPSGWR